MSSKETKENTKTSAGSTQSSQLTDGFAAIVRAHNEWLEMASQQQAHFLSAMREGLSQLEKTLQKTHAQYRAVVDEVTSKTMAQAERVAGWGL